MSMPMRFFAGLSIVLAALPAAAQCPADTSTAADDFTCYVSTTGDNANAGTRTSPLRDIQKALDVASAGTVFQTIRVFPGTYQECPFQRDLGVPGNVDLVSDAFLTVGANTTTIIDGTTACLPAGLPVLLIGDNSKIRGFTIKGGGDSGVVAYGHVTIANNIIEDNVTAFYGAGIYLATGDAVTGEAAQARIERNIIRNNTADLDGGGVFVYGPGDGEPSDVVIDSNTVESNVAGEAGGGLNIYGGGVAVLLDSFAAADSSSVVITNNTIESNEVKGIDLASASYGGGLFVATFGYATETIEVSGTNVIRNNKATNGYGGGIAALGQGLGGGTVVHDVLVEGNAVSGNQATLGGGGIYALTLALNQGAGESVAVRLLSNDVAGNSTDGDAGVFGVTGGGGIYAEFFNELSASAANQLVVEGNALRNNAAQSLGGGAALYARTYGEPDGQSPSSAASLVRFANNLVTGNRADDTLTGDNLGDGGGAYVLGLGQGGGTSAVDLEFNTFADNTADTGFDGGIAIDAISLPGATTGIGSESFNVSSSIFLRNSGYAVGGTALPVGGTTTVRIAYNDAFEQDPSPYAPQYTAGPGNITDDPELDAFFVPRLCSPTIDAGDATEGTYGSIDPNTDQGLQEERQPNGGRPNMGHTGLTQNATVTLPDATNDGLVDGVDILRLAVSFASISSQADRYFAGADANRDGDVDGYDLAYMAAWFGRACP
jgi:predicted outer membrane repeat protein